MNKINIKRSDWICNINSDFHLSYVYIIWLSAYICIVTSQPWDGIWNFDEQVGFSQRARKHHIPSNELYSVFSVKRKKNRLKNVYCIAISSVYIVYVLNCYKAYTFVRKRTGCKWGLFVNVFIRSSRQWLSRF